MKAESAFERDVERVAQLLWQVRPITAENVHAVARKVLELKPQTITTLKEVAALPNGSQIQDAGPSLCEKVDGRWHVIGADCDFDSIHITLPATVLHIPGEAA